MGRGRISPASGALFALMLDTKSTFDQLVTGNAAHPDQAQRILDNRFYRNVSGALGGTQEYMAMEKLHELHDSGNFDLIVIDTPPTRHALDFLDAPRRLLRLLDNRIFRMLMMPTPRTSKWRASQYRRSCGPSPRVVGSEAIDDVVAFFRAFEGMEAGFRDRRAGGRDVARRPRNRVRARDIAEARRAGRSALLRPPTRAQQPDDRRTDRQPRAPFVRRRGTDRVARRASELTRAGDSPAAQRLGALYDNLADFREIAELEREHVEGVQARVGATSIAFVPYLARDVYDFSALREIGEILFDPTVRMPPRART